MLHAPCVTFILNVFNNFKEGDRVVVVVVVVVYVLQHYDEEAIVESTTVRGGMAS